MQNYRHCPIGSLVPQRHILHNIQPVVEHYYCNIIIVKLCINLLSNDTFIWAVFGGLLNGVIIERFFLLDQSDSLTKLCHIIVDDLNYQSIQHKF